jgi:phenylpropionate dioxygenase-like ring-hydroxylating dioxygenase large terminal subunit
MNAPESRNLKNRGLGVGPVPIDQFFTPEYHQLEKEKVFKKSWLRVGWQGEIPNVGDYFVKELDACDTSLIVVRGRDKKIRAFHNMCTHRSNRVAYQAKGNTTSFNCSFHSWSFGLDGSLRALPEEHLFPGLDKTKAGLTEVACDVWEGFIFVNVDPNPTQTLREYLGEEIFNGFGGYFEQFVQVGRLSALVPVNWKIFLDAFIETYHFSTVHLPTAGDIVLSREFPNGRIMAFREFGRHRIASATSNREHTPTFTEGLVQKFGGATLSSHAGKPVEAAQINPLNLPDWLTDILVIFPMCNLQPLQGFFATQNYWPVGHDKTYWEFMIFMRKPENAAGEVIAEYNRAYLRDVVREDMKNLKMVQSTLASGAKKYQIVGENEPMVREGYKILAEQVGFGW